MVEEAFQYRAVPEDATTGKTAWQAIQTCREVYNHALTQEYRPAPDYDRPSYTAMQNKLPQWKQKWPEWGTVYSKCLQMAVRRIKHSENVLESLKERGFNVGGSSGKHRESTVVSRITSLVLTWIVTRVGLTTRP